MKLTRSFSVNNPELYSGKLQDKIYHQSIFAAQKAYQEKAEINHSDHSQKTVTIINDDVTKCARVKRRRKSCKHETLYGQKCVYCMSLPKKCGKCHFCTHKHLKKACVYCKCPCNCF